MTRAAVVVPFHNAHNTLARCLAALASQNLPKEQYEVIAVDDGSTDGGAEIARSAGVTLVSQRNMGAPAARNAGIAAACRMGARWVAFTDADCIASRGWLGALLSACEANADPDGAASAVPPLGAAGTVLGHASDTPAARFVDLSSGLDLSKHLAHPRYPFAPSGNVMYRREALEAVGGFDERFAAYEACDLHTRLRRTVGGAFYAVERAVVLHAHRASWSAYWKQQRNYGRGLAQFYLLYRDEIGWTATREAAVWFAIAGKAFAACRRGHDDRALLARGRFCKDLAQRLGFAATYFSPAERRRLANPNAGTGSNGAQLRSVGKVAATKAGPGS